MAEQQAALRQRVKEKAENSDINRGNGPQTTGDGASPSWGSIPGPDGSPHPQYKTSAEYCQAVQQWLVQYQAYQHMNWFAMTLPFYAMSCMNAQQAPGPAPGPATAPQDAGVRHPRPGGGGAGLAGPTPPEMVQRAQAAEQQRLREGIIQ